MMPMNNGLNGKMQNRRVMKREVIEDIQEEEDEENSCSDSKNKDTSSNEEIEIG